MVQTQLSPEKLAESCRSTARAWRTSARRVTCASSSTFSFVSQFCCFLNMQMFMASSWPCTAASSKLKGWRQAGLLLAADPVARHLLVPDRLARRRDRKQMRCWSSPSGHRSVACASSLAKVLKFALDRRGSSPGRGRSSNIFIPRLDGHLYRAREGPRLRRQHRDLGPGLRTPSSAGRSMSHSVPVLRQRPGHHEQRLGCDQRLLALFPHRLRLDRDRLRHHATSRAGPYLILVWYAFRYYIIFATTRRFLFPDEQGSSSCPAPSARPSSSWSA